MKRTRSNLSAATSTLGLGLTILSGTACAFLDTDYDYKLVEVGAGGATTTANVGGASTGGAGVGGSAAGGTASGGTGGTSAPCEGFSPTPVNGVNACQTAFITSPPVLHYRGDDIRGVADTTDVTAWCGRGTSPEPLLAIDPTRAPRFDADGVTLDVNNPGPANGALNFSTAAQSFLTRKQPWPTQAFGMVLMIDAAVTAQPVTILRWGAPDNTGPSFRIGFRNGNIFIEASSTATGLIFDENPATAAVNGNTRLLRILGQENPGNGRWDYFVSLILEDGTSGGAAALTMPTVGTPLDLGGADELFIGARTSTGGEVLGGSIAEVVYRPLSANGGVTADLKPSVDCVRFRYGFPPQ